MVKLLFFAGLRDQLGSEGESIELPQQVTTARDLRDWLCQRGATWEQALDDENLMLAVNQTMAPWDTPLDGDEEVAFFPPVTGG